MRTNDENISFFIKATDLSHVNCPFYTSFYDAAATKYVNMSMRQGVTKDLEAEHYSK